jgi:hypothetical protein
MQNSFIGPRILEAAHPPLTSENSFFYKFVPENELLPNKLFSLRLSL